MFDPSYTDDWKRALEGEDDALFKHLVDTEYPGTVLFQLAFYLMRQNIRLYACTNQGEAEPLLRGISRVRSVRRQIRSFYDWSQRRKFDLETLKEFYHGRAVMPFLGAGTSMEAGGPSWPKLVEGLLLTALEPERQKEIPVPKRGGGWYFLQGKKSLHFSAQKEKHARKALETIQSGGADTELLMNAAQMCADLFQEQFFSWVTPLLYMECKVPGSIYFALAELSSSPGSPRPGWSTIVTYNFDNLMGEMFELQGVPYSVLTVKDGKGKLSVTSDSDSYTEIIHVHGYVPREIMRIDGIQYVFSTSQYEALYGSRDSMLLDTIRMMLKKPDLYAFYIGCSFTDKAMNEILAQAAERRPGNYHFALLRLPDQFTNTLEIPEEELMKEEERYLELGVQPIWFREFKDIPELISKLA